VYLDSAYIAKSYVNEADSAAVRSLIEHTDSLVSSRWCIAEVACVFHRHAREGRLTPAQARKLASSFLEHVDSGFWTLIPISEQLLRRVVIFAGGAPRNLYLRGGDALHLTTAQSLGESEIWTNDRHLLAAAPHFGLIGRTV
jgi:predicted nucleic acid-binding protein